MLVACGPNLPQIWVRDPANVSVRVTQGGRTDDLDRGPFVVRLRHADTWREAQVRRVGGGDIVIGDDPSWTLTAFDAQPLGPPRPATRLAVPHGPSALSMIHEDEGVLRWTACMNLQTARGPKLHLALDTSCDRADPVVTVSTPIANIVYADDVTHPLWTLPQTVQVWPRAP